MWKVTIRGLRNGFGRFLLTLLAVALGVAFLGSTLTLRSSLGQQFLELSQTTKTYDLYIVGHDLNSNSGNDADNNKEADKQTQAANDDSEDDAESNSSEQQSEATQAFGVRQSIPDELAAEFYKTDGVKAVSPEYFMQVQLRGKSGEVIVSNPNAPTILVGTSSKNSPTNRTTVGKLPQGDDEINIEKGGLKAANLSVGDKAELWIDTEKLPVTVVGRADFESSMVGATIIFMEDNVVARLQRESIMNAAEESIRANADSSPEITNLPAEYRQQAIDDMVKKQREELVKEPLKVESIGIELKDGVNVNNVKKAVQKKLSQVWKKYDLTLQPEVLTRQEMIDEENKTIEETLGYINIFLLVFVGIALFVGIFIIANTFRMIVQAQQKQFAMLRAIGVSAAQLFLVVVFQGLIIGVLGSILGLGISSLFNKVLRSIISATGLKLEALDLTASIAFIALSVGIIVTLVGAVIPARVAAKTAPVEAMRTTQGANQKLAVMPVIIGLILVVIGAALTIMGAFTVSSRPGTLLGVGVVSFLLGVLALTPILAQPIAWLIAWPLRIMRPTGRLALKNVIRNPQRTAATASALTIGVTLVTLGSVMAASMKDATSSVVDTVILSPIIITSPGSMPLSDSLVNEISNVKGVKHASVDIKVGALQTKYSQPKFDSDGNVVDSARKVSHGTSATTYAISCDPTSIGRDYKLPLKEGELKKFIDQKPGDPYVIINDSAWGDQRPLIGDAVVLKGEDETLTARVAAVADSQIMNTPYTLSKATAKKVGLTQERAFMMFVTINDNESVGKVRTRIQNLLNERGSPQVAMTKDEYKNALSQQVDFMLAIVYALLALSIFIAILGIINTQSLSISERIREIGLLRAIGYSRGKIAGMVVAESIIVAVFGALLGFLTGSIVSWGLIKYLVEIDSGIKHFVFPSGTLVTMLILAVIIGILSGIIPSIRASRIRLLTAIAHDE